jgi:DNA-binding MarR family transcriptional regulator
MAPKPDTQLVHDTIAQLQRVTDLFTRRREQIAKRVGLSEAQWSVLEEISTEHFMPSLFAKASDSTPTAVSKVIRQLIDKELIKVSISASDGRQRDYELTSQGKAKMNALRQERERAIAAIWSDLDTKSLRAFNELSHELIERIERYAAKQD